MNQHPIIRPPLTPFERANLRRSLDAQKRNRVLNAGCAFFFVLGAIGFILAAVKLVLFFAL